MNKYEVTLTAVFTVEAENESQAIANAVSSMLEDNSEAHGDAVVKLLSVPEGTTVN